MSQDSSDRRMSMPWIWRRVAIVAGVVAVIAAIAVMAQKRDRPRRTQALEARLELAAGDVAIRRGNTREQLTSGAALLQDSTLTTGEGARALARLADGSAVFLRDRTTLSLRADAVQLEQGEIWVDAPPSERRAMTYQAGSVSLAADDAGLSFKREGDQVTLYVARGLATLTAEGGRVEVQAGEQAKVQGSAAPEVTPVAFWVDWTGGMGDHRPVSHLAGSGSGRIYGVDLSDRSGTAPRELEVSRQAVRAVIRDGLAETEVDQTFFNPGQNPVEGWYWFTVPAGASVTGFELETNGVLVPAELIERNTAEKQYHGAARRGFDPALLEWIDARSFRARIFPVTAGGTRRVVLRYIELMPLTEGRLRYLYPLQSDQPLRIGEFSLTVDLGEAGTEMSITTLAEARVEQGGRLVTMRRSGYTPRADFLLESKPRNLPPALRVARFAAQSDTADYLLARYTPQIDWATQKPSPASVVLVVDTSAAADDAARQLKAVAAEAILHALSAEDQFALVSLDVKPTVLHPAQDLAPAAEEQIAQALERLADHASGGATDLAALFDVALARLHAAEQPAVIYVGDGLATSGEMSGEQLSERLRRALDTSRARFFTVAVGGDADHATLAELARVGGGHAYRIDSADETTERALSLAAAIKVPTITEFDIDLGAGLDEVFISATGKISRGDEVTVLARTHHELPSRVTVRGRLAGKPFEQQVAVAHDRSVIGAFVPRLWAAEKMRRVLGRATAPDDERGRIIKLGIEYGLMTPFTSFLALESEDAYYQMGIPRRRSPLWGVRLAKLAPEQESDLIIAMYGVAAAATGLGCMGLDRAESAPAAPPADPAFAEEVSVRQQAAPVVAMAKMAAETMEPMPEAAARNVRMEQDLAMVGGSRSEGFKDAQAPGRAGDDFHAQKGAPQVAQEERKRDSSKPVQALADFGRISEQTCSDTSRRPLAQRILLWRQRLATARTAQDLLARYRAARAACEIPDWGSESLFLRMLARRVTSEQDASAVLLALASVPDTQRFVARVILRIAVEPAVASAVQRALFGNAVDWQAVDRRLSELADAEARVRVVRQALAGAADDPGGIVRLVRVLAEANRLDEALVHGRRLHDHGLMTPQVARELGDVLARHKLEQEAVRTYSEIVEFDAGSAASRRLLGDIYLAHGWYDEAYRQYRVLTEVDSGDALGWLRLAAAAAGTGRVDEALRLERKVIQAEGKPGPTDPRRWARLASAARLAHMLATPPASAGDSKALTESVTRKLKQLELFRGPSHLLVVTWEDLEADLALDSALQGVATALGEVTDASASGLSASLLAESELEGASLVARLRSAALNRDVKLRRHDITWDGKRFEVRVSDLTLPAGAARVEL
ncbi:MAG: VIT domain-containing protein [Pseudomonadota bacterium]